MFKRIAFAIGLILVLGLNGTAFAQEGVVYGDPGDTGWHGTYYNSTSIWGTPVLQRQEADLNYDWGSGSPDPVVRADGFSARWTRYIDVSAGTYRFTAVSDDGIRVYVDHDLIINGWWDHPAQTFTADLYLTAGYHLVVVEYYENMGHAVAKLSWQPLAGQPDYWRGEYYSNPWLGGSPAVVRDDQTIDFYWGYGSPAAGIPSDGFSVRWMRTMTFEPGLYRFTMTHDDGARLWADNRLLIDKWRDQPFWPTSATAHLAGNVSLKIEYYENGGVAAARLAWEPVDDGPPPPPAGIIVDDSDAGFVKGGTARYWHTSAGGQGGSMIWTWNNDWMRYNYNWARWYPDLTPGRYEVFVYVPEQHATTTRARYWISHAGGYTMRLLDQSANRGRWVSLNAYQFRGTRSDYVSLADVTYEPYLSGMIAFDAVKFVPR
jgi:hypothetical protein